MTNLVDSHKAPPRADRAATSVPGHSVVEPSHHEVEPGHPEVLRGVRSASQSRALTLIEMLVALAVTLVMMAAVVNLFANMSASIRNRRAAIETGSQLRQVRNRLAMDLSGATCRGSTWQDPAENQGYIEIIEGEWSDKNPSILTDGVNSATNPELDYTTSSVPSSQGFSSEVDTAADGRFIDLGAVTDARGLGDWDDILALTTQSEDAPFAGKVPYYNNVSAAWEQRFDESHQAEVIWFAEQNGIGGGAGEPGMRRIYRRAFLIMPNINFPPLDTTKTELQNLQDFYEKYDVSIRIENGRFVGNTLGDLTKREHRFLHNNNTFNPGSATNRFPHELTGRPLGDADWLVLNGALAFDVRVFDPGAPLVEASGSILEPNDYGWPDAIDVATPVITGYGAYCDLGWGREFNTPNYLYPKSATAAQPLGPGVWPSIVPVPQFHITHEAGWHPRVPGSAIGYPAVYDTWSYHYENDGIDQDPTAPLMLNIIDQGANGLDDNNANGVDDRGERETAPPYDVPLRGVKVILRVYEPDARQIRESSVTHSFKQ